MPLKFDYESKIFGLGKIRTSPWYIPALKVNYALNALKGVKGKVLEVGCGAGAMADSIAHYRPDLEVYGVDISRRAIRLAKEGSEKVNFSLGNIYNLPYKNDYFDAVVSFDVFEHLENVQEALGEVRRVLKKNGVLHLAIPYEGSLWNIEGWLTRAGWKAKEIYCGHVNNFALGQLEEMGEANGFRFTARTFSTHLIYQFFDALYFSLIFIRGKNFPYQAEGYVATGEGPLWSILSLLKNLFAIITYLESRLLFWFPGLTGHLTFRKK